MGLGDKYARAARDDYGLGVTWTPDQPIAVGDVIRQDRASGATIVHKRLADFPSVSASVPAPMAPMATGAVVVLQRDVDITGGISAEVGPAAAEVTFGGESSFLFVGKGGSTTRYPTLAPVIVAVEALRESGAWDDSWKLVTAVRSYSESALIISRGAGATAQVAVPVTVAPSFAAIDLKVGFGFSSGSAAQWSMVDATPFFEAVRVVGATAWNKGTVGPGLRELLVRTSTKEGEYALVPDPTVEFPLSA